MSQASEARQSSDGALRWYGLLVSLFVVLLLQSPVQHFSHRTTALWLLIPEVCLIALAVATVAGLVTSGAEAVIAYRKDHRPPLGLWTRLMLTRVVRQALWFMVTAGLLWLVLRTWGTLWWVGAWIAVGLVGGARIALAPHQLGIGPNHQIASPELKEQVESLSNRAGLRPCKVHVERAVRGIDQSPASMASLVGWQR